MIVPRFSGQDIWVSFSIYKTRRPAAGTTFKGGLSHWAKLQQELRLLLRDSSITVLSTIFDYYAFPDDAPGMADRPHGSPQDRVTHVERALLQAIDHKRFLPHLAHHQLEAWVLADCVQLGEMMGDSESAENLHRMVQQEGGPELVDDGVQTAPSKRIINAFPQYRKTIDGPRVIAAAGLDSIRQSCPHADKWLTDVENRLQVLHP